MGKVRRPYERYRKIVCNQSARTVKPKLIVMHSTEGWNYTGTKDLVGLGEWFDNPNAKASAHVGIDAQGYSALYVVDERKSWACAGFNSLSLNIEHIGFSKQTWWPSKQYRKSAKYVAYWSRKHGIPIRKARVTRWGSVIQPGVIRHSELGAYGGNHGDPGKGFNLKLVLALARVYAVKGW